MSLNVGVIFGGESVEHEISIITALQMIENMNRDFYNPVPIYISKDNKFYYHERMFNLDFFKDLKQVKTESRRVGIKKENKTHILYREWGPFQKKVADLDLVFPIVHGTYCEDGTLAGYLELLNIPYVGSNVLSSANCQNKLMMKHILKSHDLPVVDFMSITDHEWFDNSEQIIDECSKLDFPLIVKPASLGSSVGVSKSNTKEELKDAIETALIYDSQIVVEKAITDLIELNCSVLGDYSKQEASKVERVLQTDEILSYDDKYMRGSKEGSKGMASVSRVLPADIDESLTKQVQELAMKTFAIMGNSGVVRIDFLYDEPSKSLFVNEVNTIPGSLSYYLWEASGVTYESLINRLIKLGLEKYRMRSTKIHTYDTNVLSMKRSSLKSKLK
ncbi:D-alanine--D-alanine ligase family protein [Haloplasma contractile]|uniref:D-alanine--D-alanine ligase family protein n=1 Tax=Haloplasma contractile TaxID=471825 RepID=UPI000212218D|nr:D-alanine--D-alanine ligase family protein [Haloplasma contractile]